MQKTMAALAPDVDPEIRQFVERTSAAYGRYPAFETLPVSETRRICEEVRAPWRQGGPRVARIFETAIAVSSGAVRVRVYDPAPGDTTPALVYLHGGGWTVFSLDTHDRLMREYAHRAGLAVIGVDYALSPEAKFPFALEQIADVVRWLRSNGRSLGVDPARLAIGGDSAGGALSLGACLMLRDRGEAEALRGMVLNYGFFDHCISAASATRFGGPGYMLTAEECARYYSNYLRSDADLADPLTRPLHANLAGLPPAFLVIPECDVLTEQSLVLADRFLKAGVRAESRVYRGATHSFLEAMSISALANQALGDTAEWLKNVLAD